MSSRRLVNVRLDAVRLRKAKQLRARGVALSDLVREAIDDRYDRLRQPAGPSDVQARLDRIQAEFPDPAGIPARPYRLEDRRAARRAVLSRLRRRRGR